VTLLYTSNIYKKDSAQFLSGLIEQPGKSSEAAPKRTVFRKPLRVVITNLGQKKVSAAGPHLFQSPVMIRNLLTGVKTVR
jgi:hypothetical protein